MRQYSAYIMGKFWQKPMPFSSLKQFEKCWQWQSVNAELDRPYYRFEW